MNFLFLNSARKWGGNEHWTHLAASHLSLNHKVYLAYRSPQIGKRFEVAAYRLPFLNACDFYTLFRLIYLIWFHKIDVLIPTKRKDYILAGIASRLCRARNILRLGIVRDLKNKLSNRLIYHTLCDGIIVNSQAIKKTLLLSKFMRSERIGVIHNGVDVLTLFEKADLSVPFQKPFRLLVVSMGEISTRKGVDVLIKGFAQFLKISKKPEEIGLLVIGDASDPATIKSMIKDERIENHVILTGFKENPYPYLKEGDIYVSMSRNEGISNALLESMVLGLPVITTRVGGTVEFIRDGYNGYLIEVDDTEKLVKRLVQLSQKSEWRKQIGSAGSKSVMELFSVKKMTSDIVTFCQKRM